MINKPVISKIHKVLLYVCAFIAFRTLFTLIIPHYINETSGMTGPIDARAADCKCLYDPAYVELAKTTGYNHSTYYSIYFPLDLVFPIVYSSMFLALINMYVTGKKFRWLRYLVIAGCVFDYLENFSFAAYLDAVGNGLAGVVALFTGIKSVLFVLNLLVFLIGLAIVFVLLFRKEKKLPAS